MARATCIRVAVLVALVHIATAREFPCTRRRPARTQICRSARRRRNRAKSSETAERLDQRCLSHCVAPPPTGHTLSTEELKLAKPEVAAAAQWGWDWWSWLPKATSPPSRPLRPPPKRKSPPPRAKLPLPKPAPKRPPPPRKSPTPATNMGSCADAKAMLDAHNQVRARHG